MGEERDILELTREMVKFKSTKNNEEEISNCLNFIKDYFSGEETVIREYEDQGVNSLVVSFEETKDPEIMLHGHIDVVDGDKEMFEPETKDGKIHGRGTADMKAGIACLMKLMKKMEKKKPDIALMIVTDEEIGGLNGSKYLLEEKGYRPKFAITAEPNNLENGYMDIVTKQKGILWLDLETGGKSAHAARLWKGNNAVEKMIEIYDNEIRPLFPDSSNETWDTTCNIGKIEGGDGSRNKVPSSSRIELDIRWSDNYKPDQILSDIRKIKDVEITGIELNEPMLDTDNDSKYVKKLKRSAERSIEESKITRKEHASDARHFSEKGIPTVVFGPEGYNSHETGEFTVIESFEDYIDILEDFIKAL